MIFGFRKPTLEIGVTICKSVLEAIFDECDKYDSHETGGRVVGVYQKKGNSFNINVLGVIEPGPEAKRSATSFFQDGHYQERIFREIEKRTPEIEALGNWHTHHVNGYPTLSGGDVETYQRTVNHKNHNTDFFYAILVVEKCGLPRRYKTKHYFLRRNDPQVYEIPESNIRIVNEPGVWPIKHTNSVERPRTEKIHNEPAIQERLSDSQIFLEFYPKIKPYKTPETEILYWKGSIDLVDGSKVGLALLEMEENNRVFYELKIVGNEYADLVPKWLIEKKFKTARMAVRELEQKLNREVYLKGKEK